MIRLLKTTLALAAVLAIAGCESNDNGEYPSRDRTTTSYESTTYDNNASASARTDTSSGQINDWNRRNDNGPIMTDPIGRPSSPYRADRSDQRTASARLGDNGAPGAQANVEAGTASWRTNGQADTSSTEVNTNTDTSMTAGAHETANLSQQDRDFINQAASAGMFEVRSSKLIKERDTSNDSVNKFAQRMIDDHTNANRELKSIAQRKGITVPQDLSSDQQQMYTKLSSQNGANDLLSQYKQQQTQAHEQAVKLFEDEAQNGQDPDLKAFAQKYLPVLRQHLDHAQNLDVSLNQ